MQKKEEKEDSRPGSIQYSSMKYKTSLNFINYCRFWDSLDWLEPGNDFDHSVLSKTTGSQSVSPFAKSLSRDFGREQGGCETDVK